jgi:hypothetical protein
MCVIASLYLENQSILVKNRDRKYKAFVKAVHEIKNGVEVLYIQDTGTDWSEGLNEYGIGITNATLMVMQDENAGIVVKKRKNAISNDGAKIRHALSIKNIEDTVSYLTNYSSNNKLHNGLKGITIIANSEKKYVYEGTSKHTPIISELDKHKLIVRTNHGIYHTGAGYNSGIKKKSSISRLDISKRELENVKRVDDVMDTLSKQYVTNNFLNPYRRKNEHEIFTTGQILINLNELYLEYKPDAEFCEFITYDNRLPIGYVPKLRFKLLNFD